MTGVAGSLVVSRSVAVLVPVEVGVKVTVIVWRVPAVSENAACGLTENIDGSAPIICTDAIPRVARQLFRMLTVRVRSVGVKLNDVSELCTTCAVFGTPVTGRNASMPPGRVPALVRLS